MLARRADLGRVVATRGMMIPMSNLVARWEMAQDERKAIREEQSNPISGWLEYLPALATGLYHTRDLSEAFDYVMWFEFATE